ncbi:MAG: hypothetical protein ABID09_01530 [Candidatus Omnitrophota bacterium]
MRTKKAPRSMFGANRHRSLLANLFIYVLLISFARCGYVYAEELPFKTLKIEYSITLTQPDSKCEGSKTVCIDAVNNKRREKSIQNSTGKTRKGNDFNRKKESLRISTGEKEYIIYWPDTDVAYSIDLTGLFIAYEDPEARYADLMDPIGEESVLGKRCKIFEKDDEKIWLWGKILMRKESERDLEYYRIEATGIEEDIYIDPRDFELPSSVVKVNKY